MSYVLLQKPNAPILMADCLSDLEATMKMIRVEL
jgi:hypothetical protein